MKSTLWIDYAGGLVQYQVCLSMLIVVIPLKYQGFVLESTLWIDYAGAWFNTKVCLIMLIVVIP